MQNDPAVVEDRVHGAAVFAGAPPNRCLEYVRQLVGNQRVVDRKRCGPHGVERTPSTRHANGYRIEAAMSLDMALIIFVFRRQLGRESEVTLYKSEVTLYKG